MERNSFECLTNFAKENQANLKHSEKKFLTGDKQMVIIDFEYYQSQFLLVFEEIRSHTASYHNNINSISLSQNVGINITNTKYIVKRSNSIIHFLIPTVGRIRCFPENKYIKNIIHNSIIKDIFSEYDLKITIEKNNIEFKIKNIETITKDLIEKILKGIKSTFDTINIQQYPL